MKGQRIKGRIIYPEVERPAPPRDDRPFIQLPLPEPPPSRRHEEDDGGTVIVIDWSEE